MGELFIANTSRPSSTVTASFLASQAIALLSEVALQFGVPLRASLTVVAAGFASALIAYYKRENVLPLQKPNETENGV